MTSPSTFRLRLEEIDTEVAALRARLEELAITRTDVVAQLERVVYPRVLDVPIEIMSQIFLLCEGSIRIGNTDLAQDVPFVLASVCCRWRALALSMPELWNTFKVDSTWHESNEEAAVRKLELCTERAGARRDIVISLLSASKLEVIVPMVAPTVGRWSRCEAYEGYLERFLQQGQRFSSLRSLTMRHQWDCKATSPLSISAEDAPLLRHVELNQIDGIGLPWAQLTKLSLSDSLDSDKCVTVLSLATNLEYLHLEFTMFYRYPLLSRSAQRLKLKRLHTLSLRWKSECYAAAINFFDLVILPELRSFTTDIPHRAETGQREVTTIKNMLARSECGSNLRFLTLYFLGYSNHGLPFTQILATTPILERLTLPNLSKEDLHSVLHVLTSGVCDTRIVELCVEMQHHCIPFQSLAVFVSGQLEQQSDGDSIGFRCLKVFVPPKAREWYEERNRSGFEMLQHLAAQSGGPQIYVTNYDATPLIESTSQPKPPKYSWYL
uniref:F-box domain-containing protein n=1 Tax=Mycena chlorophos TaxID=658473 RepID=A0ABQ0LI49_MYCCL|nr:predicted protein [Mycena chlorophos]